MDASWPIFDFEIDVAGQLRCIPMCVRFKLDECRVKLSLKQWNRIPPDDRHRLVTMPCNTPDCARNYRKFLMNLIESHTSSPVEWVAEGAAADWADNTRVPPRIVAHAVALDVLPPSLDRWNALSPLQRFALYKLTRPNHGNDNFMPAMREFGISGDGQKNDEGEDF